MRSAIIVNIVVVFLFFSAGCEPESTVSSSALATPGGVLGAYSATNIHIIMLTEIVTPEDIQYFPRIKAYVDVLDKFDSRMKFPGTFRFELYDFVPRISEPMGKRLILWPDVGLTDPEQNNRYWRDHMRAYMFSLDLDFEPREGQEFILQATFIKPDGKRLTDTFQIKYQK